jgi:hypothetical protein
MLTGAIIGAVIGIAVALVSTLFMKPRACPECGERLPMPWFRPLKECPHCEEPLAETVPYRRGRGAPDAGRAMTVVAVMMVLSGLVAVGLFLPAALESRRVWQHQQRQVDTRTAEIRELEAKADPASKARAEELRAELRKGMWNPETYREEFATRAAIGGVGVMLALFGTVILIRRGLSRKVAARDVEDDE